MIFIMFYLVTSLILPARKIDHDSLVGNDKNKTLRVRTLQHLFFFLKALAVIPPTPPHPPRPT